MVKSEQPQPARIRLVAPWGFYGMGNTGDEGTLCGFAKLLQQTDYDIRASVGSYDPAHSARVEPALGYFRSSGFDMRRYWAKSRGTLQAIVGGTPIMDVLGDWPLCDVVAHVRNAERKRVPFIVIGAGVEGLQLGQSLRIVREEIAPRVRHWTVRSDLSKERLVEYGVAPEAITTAADLAWLIEPVDQAFGRSHLARCGLDPARPIIGVNIANENSCFQAHPKMADSLAQALDQLRMARGAQVVFLCAEVREDPTFDKAAAGLVMGRMQQREDVVLLPNTYFTPQEMMSLISCCTLTLSMRYHFCLFSALQSVPFIAIRRADKVSDLCHDLQWNANVLPPHFTPEEILDHAGSLERDGVANSGALHASIERLRARARLNLAAIDCLALNPARKALSRNPS